MLTYDHLIRVRYSEVDQMGFLYHAHYVDYYDVARTEALRSLGTSNADLEADGYMLPVVEVVSNYKNPAHYDDLLTVRVRLEALPVVKMVFHYEVFRPNGELINTGRVTLAFMRADSKRACRAPEQLLKYLRPLFSE